MPVWFQSTRPVRGATEGGIVSVCMRVFQSTRPVRGATEALAVRILTAEFQSTRPVRGATTISVLIAAVKAGFNPRAP